ncbi:MAG: DUF502 domain-containing protein [Thermodesulfovibrionales bacterium]|nr:DUF502 domain-containing protein [Thermodesulfovibrionales bacterium]
MLVKASNIFKRKFLAGLFITIPAVISISVLLILFNFVDGILRPLFYLFWGVYIPGIGFLSALIIVFFIGVISTNVFGKTILGYIERFFLAIPVFKSIYSAVKQLVNAFSPENKSSFKKFVIAEYPRKGIYAFGFLTTECSISTNDSSLAMKTVYIPTNNLYLGEIVLLDERSIIYTDIPIEDGIKIILSGGIAAPQIIMATQQENK